YWRSHEYVGVGPGAHGRLDIAGERHATATERRPETWLSLVESEGHGVITDEVLTREERSDEFLLMGLRLAEGINIPRYEQVSGRKLDPSHRHLVGTWTGGDDGGRLPAGYAARISGARCGCRGPCRLEIFSKLAHLIARRRNVSDSHRPR